MRKFASIAWGVILVIALWWILAAAINSPALPTPIRSIGEFGANFAQIWPELLTSTWRILVSMVIGTALALPLGLFLGRSKRANEVLGPALSILYPLPKIVLLPILFVLLGIGGEAKITLISIAVFFQALVTMRDASAQVPKETVDAMESFGANRWQIIIHAILPATMPALFTSLRLTTGSAIAILFIAESMAGSTGLGYYIMHSWSMLEYTRMFAGIIAMALLGVLLYALFDVLEKRTLRWSAPIDG